MSTQAILAVITFPCERHGFDVALVYNQPLSELLLTTRDPVRAQIACFTLMMALNAQARVRRGQPS